MTIARRIFRFLLWLYPPRARARFGAEMTELFELRTMAAESRTRFLLSEIAGLIAGAFREWFASSGEERHRTADYEDGHLPNEVLRARLHVNEAVQGMVDAISHHRFERARRLAYEERIERERLRRICDDYGIEAP